MDEIYKTNNDNTTNELNSNISLEIKLLLEAIFSKYGYDFRNYGKAISKEEFYIDYPLPD